MSRPLNPWKLTGYKAGQNVVCKVTNAEPGGYAVLIPKDNLPGFLPTQATLQIGEEILAQFVCVHNSRILLSARFGQNAQSYAPRQKIRWEEQLNQLDSPEKAEEQQQQFVTEPPPPPPPDPAQVASDQSGIYIKTEAERAFDVWAQQVPRKLQLKRATDLVLPPINVDSTKKFKIADYDLEWLITDLEGGMRTGCMRATCDSRLSRAAVLLYKGRAVGCIYGCKSKPDNQLPTDQSLQMMLADLELPDTQVEIYDLPESVTLSMSALFLGYPVQRNDDYDARTYMDYICNWFESKEQTACLAFSLPERKATCLGFVYNGAFCGSFYVEDQKFTVEKEFVYELLKTDAKAGVEASILPPEMTSSAVRYGFSLSMARPKKTES